MIRGGASTAIVVAALVATQGLTSGERLVTNITDMSPSTGVRCGVGRGARKRRGLVVGGGGFPVTSLVTTQSLVRGKNLIAKGALVGRLGGGGRLR